MRRFWVVFALALGSGCLGASPPERDTPAASVPEASAKESTEEASAEPRNDDSRSDLEATEERLAPEPAGLPASGGAPAPRRARASARKKSAPASSQTRSKITVSAYDFLVRGRAEARDYGLYSYLLFPQNDPKNRPRYRAALQAMLQQLELAADVASVGFQRKETNVTYVPVLKANLDPQDLDRILAQYDYALAKRILSYLGEDSQSGPYLVSYVTPLSKRPPKDQRVLVQNLAWVPPDKVGLWVKQFCRDVRTHRFWEKKHLGDLLLRMRTMVAVLAEPLEKIPDAAAERFVLLKLVL